MELNHDRLSFAVGPQLLNFLGAMRVHMEFT